MKKSRKFIFKMSIVLSFMIYAMLLSSCLTLLTTGTDKAVVPTGLSVDQNNSVYVTGPILAVDGNRVQGALIQKTVMVPAGRALTFLVDSSRTVNVVEGNRRYIFEANQSVSLPALEKGKSYRLYVEVNDDLNESLLLTSCRVTLRDTAANSNVYSETIRFNPPIRPR